MDSTSVKPLPDELTVRHVLVEANEAGLQVDLDGDDLVISGSSENKDVLDRIKEHKALIVHAMKNIPMDVIEEHYASRLRKGNGLISKCAQRLNQNPDDEKLKKYLNDKIALWDSIEKELRRLYPEYRGCPVGGCKDDATVTCQYCLK